MKKQALIIGGIILGVVLLAVIAVTLTGSEKKEREETTSVGQEEKEQKVDNADIQTTVDINRTAEFEDGIAILSTGGTVGTVYVIGEDFKVKFTTIGAVKEAKDGYIQIENGNDKKHRFFDKEGNEKYTYEPNRYEEIKLGSNGCLVITKQEDSYNSSVKKTGIYDMKTNSYILEPTEKYEFNDVQDKLEGIFELYDSQAKTYSYFNTNNKQTMTFSEQVSDEFQDGYSIKEKTDKIHVFSSNGEEFEMCYLEGEVVAVPKKYKEGMMIDYNNRVIYNLKERKIIDMSKQFNYIYVAEAPVYEDGYALVLFTNEGNTQYYTVIDKEGKFVFEPQKRNHGNQYMSDNGADRVIKTSNLSGKYFIAEIDGVSTVLDYNNKEVVKAGENEYFDGITNNAVMTKLKQQGTDKNYYKTLEGKKIEIKK